LDRGLGHWPVSFHHLRQPQNHIHVAVVRSPRVAEALDDGRIDPNPALALLVGHVIEAHAERERETWPPPRRWLQKCVQPLAPSETPTRGAAVAADGSEGVSLPRGEYRRRLTSKPSFWSHPRVDANREQADLTSGDSRLFGERNPETRNPPMKAGRQGRGISRSEQPDLP
jgi:hypothetical protein